MLFQFYGLCTTNGGMNMNDKVESCRGRGRGLL